MTKEQDQNPHIDNPENFVQWRLNRFGERSLPADDWIKQMDQIRLKEIIQDE